MPTCSRCSIRDQWWSSQGTKVREFEQRWGALHGTGPAVAVTNGSHAIDLALLATGIGEGDEVIVPAWTFVATAAVVLMVNASPVLVDVELGTGCIDPDAVEAAITPRTRAVIAVHIAGHPADMDRLTDICARHDLVLIEDCAHAHGSMFNGQMVGTFGAAGSYSFQASKLMTGGEGGARRLDRPRRDRAGDVVRQLRAAARRVVLLALSPRRELPDDRVAGCGPARSARPLRGAAATPRPQRGAPERRTRGDPRRSPAGPRPSLRPPGQLLLRGAHRSRRVRSRA